MINFKSLSRRTVLRGMLSGTAVSVALPLLDAFLDSNGEALANTPHGKAARPLPVCFGTWFWPLGLSWRMWEPKQAGRNFELPPLLKSLQPINGKFNLYSGMQVFMDGKTIIVHYSTVQGQMVGAVTTSANVFGQSIDQIVAAHIGGDTPFRSLTVACDGNPKTSWSSRGISTGMNPPETSPLALYQRLFGAGFVNPNAAEFHPNATVMVRDSVLSGVADDRQRLMRALGTVDRERLDAYFTSVRDLEHELAVRLQPPAHLDACVRPEAPQERVTSDINDVMQTHRLFNQLQTHALSCGLTRVWNTAITIGTTPIHKPGDPLGNHEHTHEDPLDIKLGYQPTCAWFADQYLAMFTDMIQRLDAVKEGNGTLLDRTLIMGLTDHGNARQHSATEMPILTAGGANGRVRNGVHVPTTGDTACRVGLTCLRALNMPLQSWGEASNGTSKPFAEVLI